MFVLVYTSREYTLIMEGMAAGESGQVITWHGSQEVEWKQEEGLGNKTPSSFLMIHFL